jgi:hypothetical protein
MKTNKKSTKSTKVEKVQNSVNEAPAKVENKVQNSVNEALTKVHYMPAERLNGVKTICLSLEESTVTNFKAKLRNCKGFENINVTKCVRCAKSGQFAGWVLYQLNGDESKWYATKHFTKDVADFVKEKETRTEDAQKTRKKYRTVEDVENAIAELQAKKAAMIAEEQKKDALAKLQNLDAETLQKLLKNIK